MKSIFRIPILFYAALVFGLLPLLTACQSDGDVGPKGKTGETGPAGPAGDQGPAGSLYYKHGFVRGTLTGTGKDGVTPFNESFSFEFASSQTPLLFTQNSGGYSLFFGRTDSTGTGRFRMGITMASDFATAKVENAYLNFFKKVGATQYKEISGDLSMYSPGVVAPADITQLSYDQATGVLTGAFTWRVEPEKTSGPVLYYTRTSTGRAFTVSGTFSVLARKAIF
jgi:hypothetical protein